MAETEAEAEDEAETEAEAENETKVEADLSIAVEHLPPAVSLCRRGTETSTLANLGGRIKSYNQSVFY